MRPCPFCVWAKRGEVLDFHGSLLVDLLLIVLGLNDELAAAGDDVAYGFPLAVQSIGRNHGVAQIILPSDHSLGCLEFTVVPFALCL